MDNLRAVDQSCAVAKIFVGAKSANAAHRTDPTKNRSTIGSRAFRRLISSNVIHIHLRYSCFMLKALLPTQGGGSSSTRR